MKYRPKHIAEYTALQGLKVLANILPYRLALAGTAGLSWIGFYLLRWRVDEAKRRIREVLGEDTPDREVNRIAKLSMRYLLFNTIDILRTPRWNKQRIENQTSFPLIAQSMHTFLEEDGRGLICAFPHMGSWELAGVAVAAYDVPLFFIVGVQRNPLFNSFINKLRGTSGTETIPRDDKSLLRKVVRNLKNGKILAMANDLRSKTKGLSVQFLGKEANMVPGMALFARQSKVPILPVVCYREGWTQHRCKIFDPIEPDPSLSKQEDWVRMTQLILNYYEEEIRKRPEQYFWYNKRWVLDPFIEEADEPSGDPPATPEKSGS